MKTFLKFTVLSAIIICGLMLFTSCHSEERIPGRVEVVERSFDSSLQDSVMIHGYVLSVSEEKPLWMMSSTIVVVELAVATQSDSVSGYFSMKLLPGIYTIVCLFPTANPDLTLNRQEFLPNERVKIRFLMGYCP